MVPPFAFAVLNDAMVLFEKVVVGLSQPALARFVSRARRAAKLREGITVLVTGSARMKALNRRFRGKDEATDVLSFPAATGSEGTAGEIAISADIASHNARKLKHPPAIEVKILVLHGILHLRGYDHERDDGQMARREQKLRRELGLPAGLIERTRTSAKPKGKRRRA